jgi:hypothetical protein
MPPGRFHAPYIVTKAASPQETRVSIDKGQSKTIDGVTGSGGSSKNKKMITMREGMRPARKATIESRVPRIAVLCLAITASNARDNEQGRELK